jgi:hypothetical protein
MEKKREIIARLDYMEIDHDDVDDLAVLRQMVAHHLHLGILPEARWSKAQIPHAVNEVLKMNASPALLGSGKKARLFLKEALSADGDDVARKHINFDGGTADGEEDEFALPKGDYSAATRIKLLAILKQDKLDKAKADGKDAADPPSPPLTRGKDELTFAGRQWRTSATDRQAGYDVFQATKQPLVLTGRPYSWEAAMNFATAWEFMTDTYHTPSLRGAHFFTVVVATLNTCSRVTEHDSTGYGEIAGTPGNEDMAYEWLGEMGVIGEERCGSGRTVEQLNLSASTIRGLAGGTAAGTTPAHLVSYFSQLFRAGDAHAATRPFQPKNKASPGSSSGGDDGTTLQLPEEEIMQRVQTYYDASPRGISKATVEQAVRAQAAAKGSTWLGKQTTHFRDFAGKITGGGMSSQSGEYQVVPGFRKATAHATMSLECLYSAKRTAATAASANLHNDSGSQLTHALAQRHFANGKWKSSRLVENINGMATDSAAARAVIAKGFGSFEQCETAHGAQKDTGTPESDWLLFVAAGSAVVKMRILDVPALDLGFSEQLLWWAEELPGIQATNVPFCLVSAQMGTLLLTSQMQRSKSMSSGQTQEADSLSFRTTPEIEEGKRRLLNHAQGQFQYDMVAMQRFLASRPPAGQTSSKRPATTGTPVQNGGGQVGTPRAAGRGAKEPKKKGDGPATKKEPATPGTMKSYNVYRDIRRVKWDLVYGDEKDSDGKSPCWHYSNRTLGCTHGSDCKLGHTKRPADYGGQHWDTLPEAKRAVIVAKVAAK